MDEVMSKAFQSAMTRGAAGATRSVIRSWAATTISTCVSWFTSARVRALALAYRASG